MSFRHVIDDSGAKFRKCVGNPKTREEVVTPAQSFSLESGFQKLNRGVRSILKGGDLGIGAYDPSTSYYFAIQATTAPTLFLYKFDVFNGFTPLYYNGYLTASVQVKNNNVAFNGANDLMFMTAQNKIILGVTTNSATYSYSNHAEIIEATESNFFGNVFTRSDGSSLSTNSYFTFNPNNALLYITSGGASLAKNAFSGSPTAITFSPSPTGTLTRAAFSPYGEYLVIGYGTTPFLYVYRIDLNTNTATGLTVPTGGVGNAVNAVKFHPTANVFYVTSSNATRAVSVYSISGNTVTHHQNVNGSTYFGAATFAKTLSLSPDGTRLLVTKTVSGTIDPNGAGIFTLSSSFPHTITGYSANAGNQYYSSTGVIATANDAVFHPNGTDVIVAYSATTASPTSLIAHNINSNAASNFRLPLIPGNFTINWLAFSESLNSIV